MDFAAAAGRHPKPPSKEEISYLLAHFSFSLEDEKLISAVQRSAKIIPFGILPNPKGLLLAFRTQDERKSVLEASKSVIRIGNSSIPLTIWPELATPPKDRGKRWRMSSVPLTSSSEEIKDVLSKVIEVSEVKLETVRNFPGVRTSFVSFWCPSVDSRPPRTLKIEDRSCSIFDPVKQPLKQLPKEAPKEAPQEAPQEPPQELAEETPKEEIQEEAPKDIPKEDPKENPEEDLLPPAQAPNPPQTPTTGEKRKEAFTPPEAKRQELSPSATPRAHSLVIREFEDSEEHQLFVFSAPMVHYGFKNYDQVTGRKEYEIITKWSGKGEYWVVSTRDDLDSLDIQGFAGRIKVAFRRQNGWPEEFPPLPEEWNFPRIRFRKRIM